MKGEGIKKLKKYLSTGRSLKVCILDNNSIEFLTLVRKRIGPEKIFEQYDMILSPNGYGLRFVIAKIEKVT